MTPELGVLQIQNHIAGQGRPAADGRRLSDHSPGDGALIATVPRSGAADVDAAVAAAKAALHGPWKDWSVQQRASLLERIADKIEDNLEGLAELESRDQGKPVSLARRVDIPRAVANFRFFAGAVRHRSEGFHPGHGSFNYTSRRPLGVVALITPWNLPLYLLSWKTAPALAMGNTIVAKPSELTPLTAAALADIIAECGAPPGVFNLVHGLGAEAGQALVEHPGVAGVSFTGGTETGKRVAATAAPAFKKLSLELGGKNATVVFDDCDFDQALAGAARAAFTNQGEICLCGSRILVQRGIYDAFLAEMVMHASTLKVGHPRQPDTQLGALVSPEHLEKVRGYVQLAREEGGTVLCGGERPPLSDALRKGSYLSPAVISDLPIDCRVATEEIFGPVVTVHPFDTEAEAVAMANGVRFGLSASVWTQDLNRAHRVAETLDVGLVWVNTWMNRDLRVPFGGVKDSGVGREGGEHSLEFFSETKNVCVQLGSRIPEVTA